MYSIRIGKTETGESHDKREFVTHKVFPTLAEAMEEYCNMKGYLRPLTETMLQYANTNPEAFISKEGSTKTFPVNYNTVDKHKKGIPKNAVSVRFYKES